MNDPVFVEAARAFAQRILKEGGAGQCRAAALCMARSRSPVHRANRRSAILAKTLDTQLATYTQDKAAAAALVKVGDLPKPAASTTANSPRGRRSATSC